jgi:uncharacterized damage-inducible protein DinB
MKPRLKFTLCWVLTLLTGLCGSAIGVRSQTQASHPHPNKEVIESFQRRWSAKGLAVAVADAMPAESYDFKPVPAEMSFGEQMHHIAQANYGKCAVIADVKSPYPESPEGTKVEKAAAVKDLAASFDYCTKILNDFDSAKLFQMRTWGKGSFSTVDMMLGLMVHMAHHRGQADVYLRLKGITPPTYKW